VFLEASRDEGRGKNEPKLQLIGKEVCVCVCVCLARVRNRVRVRIKSYQMMGRTCILLPCFWRRGWRSVGNRESHLCPWGVRVKIRVRVRVRI
jgi:hypothetical protein